MVHRAQGVPPSAVHHIVVGLLATADGIKTDPPKPTDAAAAKKPRPQRLPTPTTPDIDLSAVPASLVAMLDDTDDTVVKHAIEATN